MARDPGTCRRGGQAPARVDWHSTHESASRSTGSPGRCARRVRQAVPVPAAPAERPPRRLRQLRRCARRTARPRWPGRRSCSPTAPTCCPALARLRAEVGAELAGPAWELARLRARARPAFGADADRPLLHRATPSSRPAGRRSPRAGPPACWPAAPTSVADLGCAAGTDTIALARAGARVVAVDRDPVARELTAANAAALGLADRRAGGRRRRRRPGRGRGGRAGGRLRGRRPRPGPPGGRTAAAGPRPLVAALVDGRSRCWTACRRAVVKVAPGLDHDRVPDGVEAEWVSVGGSIVEALLWGRGLAATWRRATLSRDGDVARADRRRRPGPGAGRPGARLAARARPGADPLGADVAGRRRPGRHAGRPDDRLPDLRTRRPTPPGSAPTGSTRCCRSTSRS